MKSYFLNLSTGQYDSNLLDILLNNKFSEVQNYIEMKENKTTPTTEGTTTIAPIKKPKLSLNENVAQSLSGFFLLKLN